MVRIIVTHVKLLVMGLKCNLMANVKLVCVLVFINRCVEKMGKIMKISVRLIAKGLRWITKVSVNCSVFVRKF